MGRNIHSGERPIIGHRMRLQGVEREAGSAPESVFSWISKSVKVSFIVILALLTTRSIWSVQAIRSGKLRWACCSATEKGIEVCTPLQDALLICGPADEIEDVVAATAGAMAQACDLVLDGFRLREAVDPEVSGALLG
jgi:hypothetical protein